MATFVMTKCMTRKTTEEEDAEAQELLLSNSQADIPDQIIPELEERWGMPVTNFYVTRMWATLDVEAE